jgi:hypothetical protein
VTPRIVTLEWAEVRFAAYSGIDRHIRNLAKDRRPRYGAGRDDWTSHVVGAIGELAVAKAFGFYWEGIRPELDHAGDLARWQLRATPGPNHCLIVHREDPDHAPFLLVRGGPQTWELAGWIAGSDAKRDCYWRDPVGGRPAYFVPSTALHDLDELE